MRIVSVCWRRERRGAASRGCWAASWAESRGPEGPPVRRGDGTGPWGVVYDAVVSELFCSRAGRPAEGSAGSNRGALSTP
jgi:hypothetical protein